MRDWIDEEYRRITTVPIGKQASPSVKSTTPGPAGRPDEQHEGRPDRANTATNEEFYECSSCGRRISRSDSLRRQWGDKADSLLSHPKFIEAAPQIWAFEVEKFKAFHKCEPVPSVDEVARDWPKLAVLRLFRYTVLWWLVILLVAWLSNQRITAGFAVWGLFAVLGFLTLVVPLMLALSFPVLDGEMRREWAQGILREWNDWKRYLLEQNLERRKRKSSWSGFSNRVKSTQRQRQSAAEDRPATQEGAVQRTSAYATMWERLKAYICDFAVVFMALGAFVASGRSIGNPTFTGMLALVTYMVVSQWICHTTIGKYLFGLELRSASPNSRYPSFWTLLSRETGGRLVSVLFLCAGYWSAIGRPRSQAWSDRIAGTVVVKRTTTRRLKRFLKVLVVVSLLFTICLFVAYIYSLTSHF